ncbi:hypothetical protein V5799_026725 [Amblyomma americanum]|uniref:M13 family peptidase n=1 Tax=Amblyomma americanum TaxID=6943 RepID=A0AAQ4DHR8_AMBAM
MTPDMEAAKQAAVNIPEDEEKREGDDESPEDPPPESMAFGVPVKRLQTAVMVLAVAAVGVLAFLILQPGPIQTRTLQQQAECNTEGCRELRLFLSSTINKSADPCRDFFRFTCAAKLKEERMSLMLFSDAESEWYREIPEYVQNKTYEGFVQKNLRFVMPEEDDSFIEELQQNITDTETKVVNFILDVFEEIKENKEDFKYTILVKDVPKYLDNFVTNGQWKKMIMLHSERRYRMSDQMILEPLGARVIVFLYKEIHRIDALLLISWSVLRQMAPYADGTAHGGSPAKTQDFCYDDVYDVLEAALVSKALYKSSSFVLSRLNASRFVRRVEMRFKNEVFFSLSSLNAQHVYETNTVNVAGALIQPVLYFHGAPAGFNYGGIGQVLRM